MKRQILGTAWLILALAGCSSSATNPEKGTLVIVNQSALSISEVQFSDCDHPTWGPNRLSSGEVIEKDGERSWSVDAGCYDVRARAANGQSAVYWDVEVGANQLSRIVVTTL